LTRTNPRQNEDMACLRVLIFLFNLSVACTAWLFNNEIIFLLLCNIVLIRILLSLLPFASVVNTRVKNVITISRRKTMLNNNKNICHDCSRKKIFFHKAKSRIFQQKMHHCDKNETLNERWKSCGFWYVKLFMMMKIWEIHEV
jgi:hypothetical protein